MSMERWSTACQFPRRYFESYSHYTLNQTKSFFLFLISLINTTVLVGNIINNAQAILQKLVIVLSILILPSTILPLLVA
jgi:hypothetical protein